MRPDDGLDQGEAEPGAAPTVGAALAGLVAPGEPLEGVLHEGRREPRAVVVHVEPVRPHGHGHGGARWGVLAGVGEQVGHGLVQPELVAGHLHRLRYGAVLDLWPAFDRPVYATDFTAAMLTAKRAADDIVDNVALRRMVVGQPFTVGFCMNTFA